MSGRGLYILRFEDLDRGKKERQTSEGEETRKRGRKECRM